MSKLSFKDVVVAGAVAFHCLVAWCVYAQVIWKIEPELWATVFPASYLLWAIHVIANTVICLLIAGITLHVQKGRLPGLEALLARLNEKDRSWLSELMLAALVPARIITLAGCYYIGGFALYATLLVFSLAVDGAISLLTSRLKKIVISKLVPVTD